MPDAHLAPRVLREYRHNRLAAAEMLAASDHLAACAACRAALAQVDDGPEYAALADAVDGKLDRAALEKLTAQLSESSAAAAEFADLERFVLEMKPQAGVIYRPGERSIEEPANMEQIIVPPARTWRSRPTPLIAAAAAAVLLVAAWAFLLHQPASETNRLLMDVAGRRAELSTLPPGLRQAVESTLREEHLAVATPAPELRPEAGPLAGSEPKSGDGFRVLSPQGIVTKELRPTMSWTPLAAATGYVVTLTSLDGADVRTSPELPRTPTTWTPPAPLTGGVIYAWQVEARGGHDVLATVPAPPAGEARFQVLSDAARAELTQTEQRYGNFPLVMAVAYARAGLTQEAGQQVAELARQHPDSPVAARLSRDALPFQVPSPIRTKGAQ